MNEEMGTMNNGDGYVVDHEEAVRKEKHKRRIAELNEQKIELLQTLESLEGGDGKEGQREKNQKRKNSGEITEAQEQELNDRLGNAIAHIQKELSTIEEELKRLDGAPEEELDGVPRAVSPDDLDVAKDIPREEAVEPLIEHDEIFWTTIESLIAQIKKYEAEFGPVTNESGKTYSAQYLEEIIRGIANGSIRDEKGKDKFDYMTSENNLRNTLRQIFKREEERRKGLSQDTEM